MSAHSWAKGIKNENFFVSFSLKAFCLRKKIAFFQQRALKCRDWRFFRLCYFLLFVCVSLFLVGIGNAQRKLRLNKEITQWRSETKRKITTSCILFSVGYALLHPNTQCDIIDIMTMLNNINQPFGWRPRERERGWLCNDSNSWKSKSNKYKSHHKFVIFLFLIFHLLLLHFAYLSLNKYCVCVSLCLCEENPFCCSLHSIPFLFFCTLWIDHPIICRNKGRKYLFHPYCWSVCVFLQSNDNQTYGARKLWLN